MNAPMTIKQYVSQMRKIPGGRFTMGRTMLDEVDVYVDEVPAHTVAIKNCYMGSTPVTVGMWREYVRSNQKLSMPKAPRWGWIDDHPMVNVSWNDIHGNNGKSGYCKWASYVTGVRLSLPTEAQMEYVTKCGKNQLFPWGSVFDDQNLWCSSDTQEVTMTAPVVRTYRIHTNGYAISDLMGNVSQWCSDWYGKYQGTPRDRLGYAVAVSDPKGPLKGELKCLRGAAFFNSYPDVFRSTNRITDKATNISPYVGFRLVAPN